MNKLPIHSDTLPLAEAFDFSDVEKESTDELVIDNLKVYVTEKVQCIKRRVNQPTIEEMAQWPDGIWKPIDQQELRYVVSKLPGWFTDCNLNWIDVSDIKDMSSVFAYSIFDGDISRWNVRNVVNMYQMFYQSNFTGKNGSINGWNVSKVKDMSWMFCGSSFNSDISGWKPKKIIRMDNMFTDSPFKQDLTPWVKNGYISQNFAEVWHIDRFINMDALKESFDFDSVNQDSAEDDALNMTMKDYITEKVRAIMNNVEQEYPTAEEMEYWPDHIWKPTITPENGNDLYRLLTNLPETLLECNLNWVDTSEIVDMGYLFNNTNTDFNGDISRWNVSNVTDMHGMFQFSNFNGDISQWDVSNVIKMYYMFANSEFNGDISKWDVHNVDDMDRMFSHSLFNRDISGWDVSNVMVMNEMFYSSEFNGDISNWNVSHVHSMNQMFAFSNFNGDLTNWVKNGYMTLDEAKEWQIIKFINKKALKESFDFSSVAKDDIDKEAVNAEMFEYIDDKVAAILMQKETDYPTVEEMQAWPDATWTHISNSVLHMVIKKISKIDALKNCNLNWIDVSQLTDLYGLFRDTEFNGDISRWDVSNVKDMKYLFCDSVFNGDISKWNVSNVEDMSYMFAWSKFNGDISQWDVSNVKAMEAMFYHSVFNGDLTQWKPISCVIFNQMFVFSNVQDATKVWARNGYIKNYANLKAMFEAFDFNNVHKDQTDADALSEYYKEEAKRMVSNIIEKNIMPDAVILKELPDAIWKPDNKQVLSDLIWTFSITPELFDCNLNWIDVSDFTDMSMLFYGSHFNGDISRWDVSNVHFMNSMFRDSMFNGDISSWCVSNVEDMSYMFRNSTYTGENGFIDDWDLSNVKDIAYMLTSSPYKGDISSWVDKGYLTLDEAKNWGMLQYMHDNYIEESFNFDDVETDKAESAVLDTELSNYIIEFCDAIINSDYIPTADDLKQMETWPDKIYPASKYVFKKGTNISASALRNFIARLLVNTPDDYTANLNWINVSGYSRLVGLFMNIHHNFDVSRWDVSQVYSFAQMFQNSDFDGDLSNWNVSYGSDFTMMFMYSEYTGKNGDISEWDMTNASSIEEMFAHSYYTGDISNWNLQNVINMFRLMFEAHQFSNDLTNWARNGYVDKDVARSAYIYDFIDWNSLLVGESFNFDNVNQEKPEDALIDDALKRRVDEFVEKVMMDWETKLGEDLPTAEEIDQWPDAIWKPKNEKILNILIWKLCYLDGGEQYNLNWVDTSGLTSLFALFKGSSFNGDISRWDVSNVTNMALTFCNSNFTGDISGWDVSNVTDMKMIFSRSAFCGDISNWNISNVKDKKDIFSGSPYRSQLEKQLAKYFK